VGYAKLSIFEVARVESHYLMLIEIKVVSMSPTEIGNTEQTRGLGTDVPSKVQPPGAKPWWGLGTKSPRS